MNNSKRMANLFMDGSGLPYDLAYHSANFTLDPFITVGAGAAFNTVNNFYTIPVSTGTKVSIMGSYTQVSFAYQLGAGFNLLTTKPLSFSIGYRYLDAGNFRTDNYLRDLNVITVPWRGKLRTQEVYATLRYLIS